MFGMFCYLIVYSLIPTLSIGFVIYFVFAFFKVRLSVSISICKNCYFILIWTIVCLIYYMVEACERSEFLIIITED